MRLPARGFNIFYIATTVYQSFRLNTDIGMVMAYSHFLPFFGWPGAEELMVLASTVP
jgi:hypothetical protein